MRLACLYALLDESRVIRSQHLMAALAVWEFAEASARWVFGDEMGDPDVDTILGELRRHPEGMTRTQINFLLGRNKTAREIVRALRVLLERGLARCERQETEGRPAERWFALPATKAGVSSSSSFLS